MTALTTGPAAPVVIRQPGVQRWVLLLTSAAAFMVSLDALAVTTALPAMGEEFGVHLDSSQWVVTAYGLACASGIVAAAAVGDRWGRRSTLAGGVALFTAASVGCAVASSLGWLVAARAAQGLGAAVVLPLGLTLLTATFPRRRHSTVLGLWGGLNGLAVAAGPLVAGLVTEGLRWQWLFWVNLPLGAVVVVLLRVKVPESRGARSRLDVPGVLLLCGLAFTVARACSSLGDGAAPWWRAVLVVFVVLLAWEARTPEPLLSRELLSAPGFVAGTATAALLAAGVSGATLLVASHLQTALGAGPLEAGAQLLPWTAAPLLLSPWTGRLSALLGRRLVLVAGMTAQAAGLGWLGLAASGHPSYVDLAVPLLLAGVGIALAMPTAAAATLATCPSDRLGHAAGVTTTVQRLGAALGVAVVAAVHTAALPQAGTAFRHGLLVAAALSVLGAVAATRVDRMR